MSEQPRPPVQRAGAARGRRPSSSPRPRRGRSLGRIAEVRNLGLVGVLVVLFVIGSDRSAAPTFLTRSNMLTILTQALGHRRGHGRHDVRDHRRRHRPVGRCAGRAGVGLGDDRGDAGAWDRRRWCCCAVLVGMGFGLVNGLLVAYGRLVPFIATLAMMAAARGLAERISDKQTPAGQRATRHHRPGRQQDPSACRSLVWIFAVVASIGWVLLNRTTFGRRTFAVGGNSEAARLAGINVKRHTLSLYVAVRAVLRHRRHHARQRDHHRVEHPRRPATS